MLASHEQLKRLVENNPGQGTLDEYVHLYELIERKAPCNLLIFGVGWDSRIWFDANPGGRTVFIEHEPDWIALTQAQLPDAEIVQVSYWTRRWQWRLLLSAGSVLFLHGLPASVRDTAWDVIFVDSPQGGHGMRPGRMQSLYTASVLARRAASTEVLVHDCDREVEERCCERFLREASFLRQIRSLRHYRVENERTRA